MSFDGRGEQAAVVVAAINSRDPEQVAPLLHPQASVQTGRKAHAGAEAVIAWAEKRYDHLDRSYAVSVAGTQENAVLMVGDVQYVWSDGGQLGDSSPVALTLVFDGDLLLSMRVDDDPDAALAAFRS